MHSPLISIIIPTYNRVQLIGETLDSVLFQTYENWECIVVDDGSTDGTDKLVDDYVNRDNRFKYLKNNRTKGAQGARNTGILNATGDYIQFLDSDDILEITKFEKQISVFKDNSKLDMAFCLSEYFQRDGGGIIKNVFFWNQNQQSQDYIFDFLMDNPVFNTNEPLWKRTAIEQIGFWDEELSCWQDWVYHIKALSKNVQYTYVNEVLSFIDDTPKKLNSVNGYGKFEKLRSRIKAGMIVKNELLNQGGNIKYKRGLCFHFILIARESIRLKNYDLVLMCQNFISNNSCSYKIYFSSILIKVLLKYFKSQKSLNFILDYQHKIISNNYINTWKSKKIN